MLTYSGNFIDVTDIQPEDLNLQDICRSLSLQCRWNGHLGKFYSVAQHSMVLAEACRMLDLGDTAARWALCHDFTETYFSDVPLPVKRNPGMEWFCREEDRVGRLVKERWVTSFSDVWESIYSDVDKLDKALAVVEYEQLAEYRCDKSDELFESAKMDQDTMEVLRRALYKVSGTRNVNQEVRCWCHKEAHARLKLECRTCLS